MSVVVSLPELATALPPIPVTVVTGFLGAGKTTLLRGLVQRRQSRRLALLINEFGEVAIDGDLLRAEGDAQGQVQIQDFAHGLIAYGDDAHFVPAMLALAARRAQIDHVLIETSGLALPSAVMEVLQGAELARHFVLDATLAVVDTPLLLEDAFASADAVGAATAQLFRQQLECADVVVLNKIDGMEEAPLLQAEQAVRALAPNVRFLELAYGARLDIRLALGLRLHQAGATVHHHYTPVSMPGERAQVAPDQRRFNGHVHSGLGAHSHGLSTHKHFHEQDPGWQSFTLRSQAQQDAARLRQAVAAAALAEPILRAKGFVHTDQGARLVQAVRARVVVAESGQGGGRGGSSELVFIGYHPSRAKVARILSETTGVDWT
ncbi:CobW family GTP-binding protein [Herbaspirillum seropedicae]|uniref:CobW family GTP-binding protein n=1 Tax=Herbaspirillum seropedicae TaxID=964 RepID=UPI00084827A9|nr:GTP-binding protein [Herbaspirillum seropedicae]